MREFNCSGVKDEEAQAHHAGHGAEARSPEDGRGEVLHGDSENERNSEADADGARPEDNRPDARDERCGSLYC